MLGEETVAGALAGVEGESVAQMISGLSLVKENLRRLISHAIPMVRRESGAMAEALRKPAPQDEAPETPRPPIAPVVPADKRSKQRTAATDKVRRLRRRQRVRWVLFALFRLRSSSAAIGTSPAAR